MLAVLALSGVGCQRDLWDDFTSRDWRLRDVGKRTDPLSVLRTSEDGDARAKAMAKLKEPILNGGSEQAQNDAVQILSDSATKDTRALCRLAAIDALGRFQDARATAALVQSYHTAGSFPLDVSNSIRVATMTSLAHKQQPEAVALIVQAATQAQAENTANVQPAGFIKGAVKPSDNAEVEKQLARDVRLSAIRALSQSKSPQATAALIQLLGEKDVAIRDRAHEALQAVTGRKDIPPDQKAWQQVLDKGGSH
jgi:HEAT repeat protein